MLEMISSLCWGGLGWLLVYLAASAASWVLFAAAALLAAGLGVLLLAWQFRRGPM
jgi:ABC-2 type transport system permease protein